MTQRAPAARLVLATRNPGKAREVAAIYAHLPAVWLTLADFPALGPVEESGATYAENAVAKARAAAAGTGLVALADDSGIEVDALGGAPGVHSARFLGAAVSDAERNARILQQLGDAPAERRTARFRAAVAVALPNGPVRTFEGTCEGRIALSARGRGGFGYDPIFVPGDETQTMGELPPETKNRISHRARALHGAEAYVLEVIGALQERSTGSAE